MFMGWFFYNPHQVAEEGGLAVTVLVWSLQLAGLDAVTALSSLVVDYFENLAKMK
jgi:heme/copper-type cytochrome/quinol oxidase subunit 1